MAIDKVLKIEGSSITWTCKQIVKMIEKDTISFKNVVQRSFVWEKHRSGHKDMQENIKLI